MPIPATWSARLLSVMRIVVALVFFSHGISKFF
ncbi:MAG: DoxX family protein, partial [Sphingomonas sp.]